MNILICISHVPETTTRIQFDSSGKALNENGVTFVINPYDEFALSRALEFQETTKQVTITILCVGGPEVEPTIRKALAVGGEEGVRIDAPATDPHQVAQYIAEYAQSKSFDLIMMGKESIDFNGAEVPGMVAEILNLPFVSFATGLELNGNKAQVVREIEGGTELLEVELPFVLSAQKGLAEWRIANMRGIMAARKKPVHVIKPTSVPSIIQTVGFELPAGKSGCQMIDANDVDKLVDVLAAKGII
jgi:electron transfer flavoprotein beta subunit